MKRIKSILIAVGILAAFTSLVPAQTNVVTVTNIVTVVVTNVVTVTNLVVAVPAPAPAVVVVPPAPVRYPWLSSISAGATVTRGNSHTLLYSGNFLTEKKTPINEISIGADGAYGSQNSVATVNNYHAFTQWNHLFTERFYDYVRVDGLRDIIADLNYRINVGPGVGYYFVKQTNTFLSTEAGAGYQNEDLGGTYNSFCTLRLDERFEHKFDGHARFWQNLELVPQVDDFNNYVLNAEIGLETVITKSVSLKTCVDDSYQNVPAAGRQKNDFKLISGITYKF